MRKKMDPNDPSKRRNSVTVMLDDEEKELIKRALRKHDPISNAIRTAALKWASENQPPPVKKLTPEELGRKLYLESGGQMCAECDKPANIQNARPMHINGFDLMVHVACHRAWTTKHPSSTPSSPAPTGR